MLLSHDGSEAKQWLLNRALGRKGSVSKEAEIVDSNMSTESEDNSRVSLRGGSLLLQNFPSFMDDSASQASSMTELTTSSLPPYTSEGRPPPYPVTRSQPNIPRTISKILLKVNLLPNHFGTSRGVEYLVRWKERKFSRYVRLKSRYSDA